MSCVLDSVPGRTLCFKRAGSPRPGARVPNGDRKLCDALALWRASPLADLAYEPFAQEEIARLEELHLGVVEQRIDADLATGRHADVCAELQALIGRHPVR